MPMPMNTAGHDASAADPSCLPALPFTPADFAAADAAHRSMRAQGVRLGVSGDHPSLPDAGEIYWPGRADVRWLVWRNAAGVWLDELDSQALHGPVATMAEALATAAGIMDAERQAGVDAIPPALVPPLPPLFG